VRYRCCSADGDGFVPSVVQTFLCSWLLHCPASGQDLILSGFIGAMRCSVLGYDAV
jgi:hypothetical protein